MSKLVNIVDPVPDASSVRAAIVVSAYHRDITHSLLDAAVAEFLRFRGQPSNLHVFSAPGAFELVPLAVAAAEHFDVVVALGCIVKGETRHDEVIANAVVQSLANITVNSGTPVALGLLTVNTLEQARARAQKIDLPTDPIPQNTSEKPQVHNKGTEAMSAALHALAAIHAIHAAAKKAPEGADASGR